MWPYMGYLLGGNFSGATGQPLGYSFGIASAVHNGPGSYSVFLATPVDPAHANVLVSLRQTAATISAVQVAQDQVDVLTTDIVGAPADAGFVLAVFRMPVP